MLLSVPEALVGQDYLTARDRLRVTFRGEAPKRAATNPTEYLLYSHSSRRELRVPGSYMLETLDADSPLVGTAPRLDAFALKDVRWCREHVGQLSDADLAELATIDSRPGVRSAVASEVLRRAKERPVVAEPIVEPDREPLDPTEHILYVQAAVGQAIDDIVAAAPPTPPAVVLGDLPTGEPLDPPDRGIAAAFPEVHPEHPVTVEPLTTLEEKERALALAGSELGADLRSIQFRNDRPSDIWWEVTVNHDEGRPGPARLHLGATPEEAIAKAKSWLGSAEHIKLEPADEELTQATAAAEATFGDRLLNLGRHPTAGWSLQLTFGNVPRTPFLGSTPAEVIAAGQAWLERYTAPVTVSPPQPKRRQVRSAEPSADVAQKLATLEADNARLAGELAAATAEGAMVVELLKEAEEERDDAKASRDRYHAELLVENSRCADAMATANRVGPKVAHLEAVVADKDRRIEELAAERDETCAELRRVGAERDRLREEGARHEAEVTRLGEAPSKSERILMWHAEPKAPPLSPEGRARAEALRRAYLTLADAAAWTVAAEEAQAVLRGGG